VPSVIMDGDSIVEGLLQRASARDAMVMANVMMRKQHGEKKEHGA
jgi:hypothetical protein